MKRRRWAKYVAVLVMLALVGPGAFLMAGAIEQRREQEAAAEAQLAEACDQLNERLVTALDAFTGRFRGVDPLAAQKVPPMPSMDQFRDEARRFADQIEVGDCPLREAEDSVAGWRDDASGSEPLADAVRGALAANVLDVLAGGSTPPRVSLGPDEDLATAVSRLPAGATLVLPAGDLEVDRSVVVVQDLVLEGAGSGETTVTSTAADMGVLLASPVALTLADLTLRHAGGGTASVLVVRAGAAEVSDAVLSGATLAEVPRGGVDPGAGERALLAGGSGIVLAGGQGLELRGVTLEDNDVAGVVAAGAAAPDVTDSTFRGNGLCGICYVGDAGGRLRHSAVTGNGAGVMLGDRADPVLEANSIEGNRRAGIVMERGSHPVVRGNQVRDNGSVGIALYGTASPRLHGNTVSGHEQVGVLVDGRSAPRIEGNQLADNGQAALVYLGASSGRASRNSCSGSDFALVLDGTSRPVLGRGRCAVTDQRG